MNFLKQLIYISLVVQQSIQYEYESESDQYKSVIDIQISLIDSPIIQMHWCGTTNEPEQKLLALTSKGTLYKSEDHGRQWTKLSEMLLRKALVVVGENDDPVGTISNIAASPVDSYTLVLTGSDQVSWVTNDCAQNVQVIAEKKVFRNFQWHPTNKYWILASSWRKCPPEDANCKVYRELHLSKDSGVTWQTIATHVEYYGWARYPSERILACIDKTNTKSHQSLISWNTDSLLYYSDDFFKTRKHSVPAIKFFISKDYLFVTQIMNSNTQEVSLLVSQLDQSKDGYTFNIIDADNILKEHSYIVLDANQKQVFMLVNHLKPSSPLAVMYKSDSTGQNYHRALENLARIDGGAEIHKVLGMNGVFLANVFAEDQAKMYTKSVFEDDQSFSDEELKKFKQTRITMDNGLSWKPLQPPNVDSLGKIIKCDPKNCALNLHLNQHDLKFGPAYSQNNSIGIIIACGSISKYLSYRQDQINTYMSRDGGLTWIEIHKGSHIYEISDHGGLIIIADNQKAQSQILYSWNEGLNWETLSFSKNPIEIDNIVTEPLNSAMRFIVYGTTDIEINGILQQQGVIIALDMEDLHQRVCQGVEEAGSLDSDYEIWSPSGLSNTDCLFGQKITYIRRKQESQCYNPEQLDRILSNKPCPCQTEDYECIPGFKWNSQQQACIQTNFTINQPQICQGYYTILSGYRKIDGDICEGGIQHLDIKLKCPRDNFIIDIIIAFVILVLIYTGYKNQDKIKQYLFKQKQQIKENIEQKQQQSQKINISKQDLEDNEKALGYSEFDEDLFIDDEPNKKEQLLEEDQFV